MIPHERSLVDELKDKPFALIGINNDGKDAYLAGLKELPVTWRSFDDSEGHIAKTWNVNSYPTIFVLDQDGVIRHKNLRGAPLEQAIKELVAAAEAKK